MGTRKKKPPWNAGLPLPEWAGGPPHVVPPPLEGVTVGHSIAPLPECLRCERVKLGRDPGGLDHTPRCAFRGTGGDPEPEN